MASRKPMMLAMLSVLMLPTAGCCQTTMGSVATEATFCGGKGHLLVQGRYAADRLSGPGTQRCRQVAMRGGDQRK